MSLDLMIWTLNKETSMKSWRKKMESLDKKSITPEMSSRRQMLDLPKLKPGWDKTLLNKEPST